MLKTNFVKNANNENGGKFYKAVAHVSYQMEVKSCDEAIKKAQNQRDSDGATDAEKKVAEEAIKALTECRDKAAKNAANFLDDYSIVVKDMTAAGNPEIAVKNCISILATDGNRNYVPLAWTLTQDDTKKLKNALDLIHVTGAFSESGMVSNSAEIKEAVKTARGDIERVMKDEFSIPVETAYTKKFMCNCNASDLRMIHETYVTGLRLVKSEFKGEDPLTGIENNKSDWYTVKLEMQTALQTQTRKGKTTIRNKRFCQTLAQIVMTKYSK